MLISSIYMSVATFYALDKVIDYFAKKYSDFWKKVDNKLFDTEKIDSNIKFSLKDLKNKKIKFLRNIFIQEYIICQNSNLSEIYLVFYDDSWMPIVTLYWWI